MDSIIKFLSQCDSITSDDYCQRYHQRIMISEDMIMFHIDQGQVGFFVVLEEWKP